LEGTSDVGLPFEGLKYKSVYEGIVDLIEEIKTEEYHSHKWSENCKKWARKGW
jgi:hypothetical protein